jgi:hypothetical protein
MLGTARSTLRSSYSVETQLCGNVVVPIARLGRRTIVLFRRVVFFNLDAMMAMLMMYMVVCNITLTRRNGRVAVPP